MLPLPGIEELTSALEGVKFPAGYVHPALTTVGHDGYGYKAYYAADDVSFDVSSGTLKAWYDTSPNWNSTIEAGVRPGTANSAYNRAKDGSPWIELDVVHYQGHFDQLNIWFSDAAYTMPFAFSGGAGHMWGLLDLVNDYSGYGWVKDSYTLYADTNSDGTGDTWLTGDFYLICDLDPLITSAQTGWEYGTNNPMKGIPTPEPTTLLLLGSGLIGVARFARKKMKK